MKIEFITFMVSDLNKTVAFYQEFAGLGVTRRFNAGPFEIAFMADSPDGTALEFVFSETAPKIQSAGMTIDFLAKSDLESLRERLLNAGYGPTEIVDSPPKPAHFSVEDPNGINVEFTL